MAGDGRQNRTAWAGVGDAILAYDANNDGVIDKRNEIVFTGWDPTASSDMEALRNVFDTNVNGLLDAGDAEWGKFKLVVTNTDGTTSVQALSSQVTSIGLSTDKQQQVFDDGSMILGLSNVILTNSQTRKAADVALVSDSAGYSVTKSATTNAGVSTFTTTARDASGVIASKQVLTTSNGGATRELLEDVNGDGVDDRRETDVTTVAGSVSTKAVARFDVYAGAYDYKLSETKTATNTTTGVVTVDRDLDGNSNGTLGYDQRETRTINNSTGAGDVSIFRYNPNGSYNGKTHSFFTDTTTGGVRTKTETTYVDADSNGAFESRTAVTDQRLADGSEVSNTYRYGFDAAQSNPALQDTLLGRTYKITDADGSDSFFYADYNGDNVWDFRTETSTTESGTAFTTLVSNLNADGSLRDRRSLVVSKDGLTQTEAVDMNGDGTYDASTSDVTVVGGGGVRTQTLEDKNGAGTAVSRTIVVRQTDGIPPRNPPPPRNEPVSAFQIRQTWRLGIPAWRLVALKAVKVANCRGCLGLQSPPPRAKPANTRAFSHSREKSPHRDMAGWGGRILSSITTSRRKISSLRAWRPAADHFSRLFATERHQVALVNRQRRPAGTHISFPSVGPHIPAT